MIRHPIHEHYALGLAVEWLRYARSGCIVQGPRGAKEYISTLLHLLEHIGLPVAMRVADPLRTLLDGYGDDRNALGDEESAKLSHVIHSLSIVLEAELRDAYAYIVTPKRFATERLCNDVASLMSPGVYGQLPELAQFDLREAGTCIAFEMATAAAFHLLRATECVLKAFYCSMVKRKRAALMWGPMVADLRKRRCGKGHDVLLKNLDHIRIAFRNPTQHPEARYDIHASQDLWGLCVDAINRMAPLVRP